MNIWLSPPILFGMPTSTSSRDPSSSHPQGRVVTLKRHCYNCGGIKHFLAECPYENNEDHGGWLIPKRRSSKFSFSKKHRNKDNKKEGERLLVAQEEYDSGTEEDDDSDDEENGEMAAVAIVSTPPTSLFN
jgi:hypothetical protein